jgi:hypothetical protein
MTTESNKQKRYDRPVLFRTAWEYARYVESLVQVPASKLFPHAIRVVWKLEKGKEELALATSQMSLEQAQQYAAYSKKRLFEAVAHFNKNRA